MDLPGGEYKFTWTSWPRRQQKTNVWTEEEVLTRDTLDNNKAIKAEDRVSEYGGGGMGEGEQEVEEKKKKKSPSS